MDGSVVEVVVVDVDEFDVVGGADEDCSPSS